MLTEAEVIHSLMQWRPRLSAAAWVVVRDTHVAEDIYQNVAVKAMTRDVEFENESALLSWAFIATRHEGIDWVRKQSRERLVLNAELLSTLESEWCQATAAQGTKSAALVDCLEAAPETSRRILRQRYFEGYSCGEVAEQLGISLDALYKRISRLHTALRECVEAKLNSTEAPGVSQ